ncbi:MULTISPECIES: TetR/AcrR family transcriptional regulator [Burkholderia cepacia complex]|uniref:TetR/AcrR family transcriptional regulator n=2 Tax=Burkholderia cepacia complex TaxID=87882 RepID=A0A3Q9F5Z2_9BURK|nr:MULTISPECIES: TetR/AcrR family transcriptional regulator [Burkholderia cepacia complex]AZQ53505.1 TetR/AcrR family transcriptional regulator [Burkholderia cenocepacia]MCA7891740.1 TetR/AcrR family transcriptional regulator [Burkholderia cepacia]MCA7941974.1 TetR/AcrR family transcriptional regulator [Burkholderia cepacia]TDA46040.1 TetR/AcrR family transcriptional regulator [Burkholderia pyrrocinia]BAX63716.1 TetR family transcriptional regulator [Burkholderia stabilis]
MKRPTTRSKESTHERIVDAGARAIRRFGFDGIGIADIMKLAGLTHGGFYAHFASREVMLAELVDRAGAEAVETFLRIVAAAPTGKSQQALLRAYLSQEHVKNPESGCPVASLGTDLSRQSPAIRRAATRRIKDLLSIVSRHATDREQPDADARALVTAATMIGAVVLARAVDEEALSEAVLSATRAHLVPETD